MSGLATFSTLAYTAVLLLSAVRGRPLEDSSLLTPEDDIDYIDLYSTQGNGAFDGDGFSYILPEIEGR